MQVTRVTIVRGTVFFPDPAGLAAQRLLNMQAPGYAARNGMHLQKYVAGQTAILPESEARRLMVAGIVEPVL
jgi:hypothetical protein